MKKRKGFVSNSSSSSFIIQLYHLSQYQIDMIMNHVEIGKEVDKELIDNGGEAYYEYYEEWNISIDDFALWAYTSMDNFPLEELLENKLGISPDHIKYMGDGWGDSDINDVKEYQELKKLVSRKNKINTLKNNSNYE